MVTLRFDNIILDLDGTLVDSFQDIYSALTEAADHLGLPVPADSLMRDNMHLRLDQLVELLYPDADRNTLMKEFRNNYDGSGYPHTRPYSGVVATLQTLRQNGCRLFVATNKRKVAAETIISRFDRDHIIEDIKTSDCATPPLTKDEIVRRILVEKGLDPERTALVGDTKSDWEAALINGVFFILASYGYGKFDNNCMNRSDTLSIGSFSQLTRVLHTRKK